MEHEMSKRPWPVLFVLVFATVAASAAGPEPKYKTPRTENGQPDLQGVWNFSSDVPLERPSSFADKKLFTREELEAQRTGKRKALEMVAKMLPIEAAGVAWLDYAAQIEDLRTSRITYPENGRLPKLVDGVRRVPGIDDIIAALNDAKGAIPPALAGFLNPGKREGHEDMGLSDRCLGGSNPPLAPGFDNNYVRIIQSKDQVVLLTETWHHARIVPLDGRPHLRDSFRSWSGDSRGHWEGDTLVVDSRNFSRRMQSFAGAGNAYDKVVTERFTRVSKNAVEYEATVMDAKTFQDKIVVSFPMAKSDSPLYEVACHEGNYSISNILAGARAEEREAMKTQTTAK
jgi:hypothetical protein